MQSDTKLSTETRKKNSPLECMGSNKILGEPPDYITTTSFEIFILQDLWSNFLHEKKEPRKNLIKVGDKLILHSSD